MAHERLLSTQNINDGHTVAPSVHPLALPWEPDAFAIVIRNAFTAAECQNWIRKAEQKGFESARIHDSNGHGHLMEHHRKGDRCFLDDPLLAETLWQRIQTCLEQSLAWKDRLNFTAPLPNAAYRNAVGLNERLRVLRYCPGGFFAPHSDGYFQRSDRHAMQDLGDVTRAGERSFVTCQVYLNDCLEGGATEFLDPHNKHPVVSVACQTGSVLLFDHPLLHAGAKIIGKKSQKYTIRTDVMYTRNGPGHEYCVRPFSTRVEH